MKLFLLSLALILQATAAPLLYTVDGVFGDGAPTTAFSGAGQTFSMSFIVDSNPATTLVDSDGFSVPFSNFQLALDGSPTGVNATDIRFFPGGGGGYVVCFVVSCYSNIYNIFGPQMFLGTADAPTMLEGSFDSTLFDLYVNDQLTGTQANITTVVTSAVPEPSTFLLLSGALAGLGIYRRSKR